MTSSYPADLTKHYVYNPAIIERINVRKVKQPLVITEPDPSWRDDFESIKKRIEDALGPAAKVVSHVGSTSIPGMPAKPVIDLDLTVPDVTDEPSYAPALEAAGFLFLTRERSWHEHRLFTTDEPHCNIHIFAEGSTEPMRHLIFKEWLLQNEGERVLYAQAKRDAAAASNLAGEDIMAYNSRKEGVIRQILTRAFEAKGIDTVDSSGVAKTTNAKEN